MTTASTTASTALRAIGDTAAARRAGRGGPHDVADLDPDLPTGTGTVDFGALYVPVPPDGTVAVELPADGRLQAVHVSVGEGRLSMSALAAPRTGKLWPDLAAEIDASLREGGARVRSYSGDWGRELHATTGAATSIFVGVDGPRWMVYGVATGPTRDAVALDARLRRMVRGTVVVRGRSPYPVRTVLPLVVPPELAVAWGTGAGPHHPGAVPVAANAGDRPGALGIGATAGDDRGRRSATCGPAGPGAATAAFVAVVRAARPGPEMSEGVPTESLPVIGRRVGPRPVAPGPGHRHHTGRVDDLTTPDLPVRPAAATSPRTGRTGNPASTPVRTGSSDPAPPRAPTPDGGVSGPAAPGTRVGTQLRPDDLTRPPGPSGEELFTPGSPTGRPARPDRDRSVDGAAPEADGVRADQPRPGGPGRHARPEQPAWRWPDDHPAPVSGRRAPLPGPARGGRAAGVVHPWVGAATRDAAPAAAVALPAVALPAVALPAAALPRAGRRRSVDRAGSTSVADLLARVSHGRDRDAAARGGAAGNADRAGAGGDPDRGRHRRPEV